LLLRDEGLGGIPDMGETADGSCSSADCGRLQPPTDWACRRARANQGQALRVAAKDAASLDRPCARRLREL